MTIPKGSIKELTIQSMELSENIEVLVYLPANYSPLFTYNLLIAQDGRDYLQLGRIGRLIDELLFKQEIERMLFVGIPYKNMKDRRNKYHPEGEQHKSYIRFLAHELVPRLEKEFSTYPAGSSRALIGDSLGATISLLTALHYPHTFGKILLQSPFVDSHVFAAIDHFFNAELLDIYHIVGNNETEVTTTDGQKCNFTEENRKLSKLFSEKSGRYFYHEFNGEHAWTYWQPDLKRALKVMFGGTA